MRRGRKKFDVIIRNSANYFRKERKKIREDLLKSYGEDLTKAIALPVNPLFSPQYEELYNQSVEMINTYFPGELTYSPETSEDEIKANTSVHAFLFPPSYYPVNKRVNFEKTLHTIIPVENPGNFSLSLKGFKSLVEALFPEEPINWVTATRIISRCKYDNINISYVAENNRQFNDTKLQACIEDVELNDWLMSIVEPGVAFRLLLDTYINNFFNHYHIVVEEDTFVYIIRHLMTSTLLNLIGLFNFPDLKLIVTATVVNYILDNAPTTPDKEKYKWQFKEDYFNGLVSFDSKEDAHNPNANNDKDSDKDNNTDNNTEEED